MLAEPDLAELRCTVRAAVNPAKRLDAREPWPSLWMPPPSPPCRERSDGTGAACIMMHVAYIQRPSPCWRTRRCGVSSRQSGVSRSSGMESRDWLRRLR